VKRNDNRSELIDESVEERSKIARGLLRLAARRCSFNSLGLERERRSRESLVDI